MGPLSSKSHSVAVLPLYCFMLVTLGVSVMSGNEGSGDQQILKVQLILRFSCVPWTEHLFQSPLVAPQEMSAPTPPPLTVRVWPHTQCTWLVGLAASGALALAAPQQAALPLLPRLAASIGARLALGAPLLASSLYFNNATRELGKAGGERGLHCMQCVNGHCNLEQRRHSASCRHPPVSGKPIPKLVTSGPYRRTRNPIYVSDHAVA